MANQKPTLPITRVFTNLFYSFPKLVIANMMFGIPLSAFFALFWALSSISGLSPAAVMLIRLLTIIPVFPFYAGVAQVTAHLVKGDKDINVPSEFITAVKENFGRFLIHGIVLFAVVIFSYLSISFYAAMLGNNPALFAPMIVSILFSVFVFFTFFYVPAMTVTFDIPMKSIYKNSFLMSFGELKKNLIAVAGLFFLFIVVSTFLFACMGNAVAIIIVTIVIAVTFVPSVATFLIYSSIYQRMYDMVVDNTAQKKSADKRKLKTFEIDENADGDEYLFFEGRMIKRSVLIRMKNEVLESELK